MRTQRRRIRIRPSRQNNIADKLLAPRPIRPRNNRRLRHAVMPHQRCLDLPRLNPEAANLNLMVRAPHKLQNPIPAPARQVPAAVHPPSRSPIPIRNKALTRQPATTNISPPNPSPRYVKLPNHPNRHRLQTTILYVNPRVPNRSTNRNLARAIVTAWPIGYVDGSFGGTVKIFHVHVGQQGLDLVAGLSRERLAATDEAANGCASPRSLMCQEHVEHRRHKVQRRYILPPYRIDELRWIPVRAGRRHYQTRTCDQRPEEFPHGHVKAKWRFLQDRITWRQVISLLHPAQTVVETGVRVRRGLGLAGRSRRKDGVDQLLGMRRGGQSHLRLATHVFLIEQDTPRSGRDS